MKNNKFLLMLVLLGMCVSPILHSDDKKPPNLKISSVSYSKVQGKDNIKITVNTDLPAGTILKCRLTSNTLGVERREIAEAEVASSRLEITAKGNYQVAFSNFLWDLPPAIYVVSIELDAKQRKTVSSQVPPSLFGNPLAREVLVIGGNLEELINLNRQRFKELTDIYVSYKKSVEELNAFIEQSNRNELPDPGVILKDWYAKTIAGLNKIIEKADIFSADNYPGWFRMSYRQAATAAGSIIDEENTFVNNLLKRPVKEGVPTTKALTPVSEMKISLDKEEFLLTAEAVFEALRLLQYEAETINRTYQSLKDNPKRQDLWKSEDTKQKTALSNFDQYFQDFQKKYDSDKLKFRYAVVAKYYELVNNLCATYAKMIAEGESEILTNTLNETLKAMDNIIAQSPDILRTD